MNSPVDGGLLVRVPGLETREMGADVVVGVDVGYRGWHRETIPQSLVTYSFFVTDIAQWELQRRREADGEYDMMILPDVRDIDPYSFANFDAAVQAGRDAALASLPSLRAKLES